MERKKILWISDGVVPTGFARVTHSILKYFPHDRYDVHHLAVNYYGDPHEYTWKIYPAASKGNIYGVNRIKEFSDNNISAIFILNDVWISNIYLDEIKKSFKKIPPIIIYIPVDAEEHDASWYKNFDIVTKAVTYTKFGYDVIKNAVPSLDLHIVPHGIDRKTFFKINKPRYRIKADLFPEDEQYHKDSFIVLNANRNQPRKRIDLALEGFSLFAKGKPNNVKYYHHAGVLDMGWDVIKLSERFGMSKRLILTNLEQGVQKVPDYKLNLIYNASDVGLNCSMGEGFGLPNVEHAVTGAPQVVPDNSASRELFHDCGLLIPVSGKYIFERILTVGSVVKPEDVAEQLENLYNDRNLYNELSEKGLRKFTSDRYSWEKISREWIKMFDEVTGV